MSDSGVVAAPALVGKTVAGRYLLEALLGSDARRAVYQAKDSVAQRRVAISLLSGKPPSDTFGRAHFERTAHTFAALEHPNLGSIVDYGVTADSCYLVTEWLEGETLASRLRRTPLNVDAALSIVKQLLAALAAAHTSGLVHGNLTPSSVFLQRRKHTGERVKLLDFGLPKLSAVLKLGARRGLKQSPVRGTSEEPATSASDLPLEPRSDVHAVGVVLSELLGRRLPRPPAPLGHAGLSQSSAGSVPAPLAQPSVDSALEAVIQRALSSAPHERFADAAEMLSVLVDALPRTLLSAPVEAPEPEADEGAAALVTSVTAPTPIIAALVPVDEPSQPVAAAAPNQRQIEASRPRGPWLPSPTPTAAAIVVASVACLALVHWARSDSGERLGSSAPKLHPSSAVLPPPQPLAAAQPYVPTETAIHSARLQDPAPQPATPLANPKPAARADASARRVPARNPWLAAVPAELQGVPALVTTGARVSEATLRTLHVFNHDQAGDARGHLLLGRLYFNRLWRADAVSEFSIALRIDPSVRGAPEILPMLLQVVMQGKVADAASDLIVRAYGSEAIKAVDDTLAPLRNTAAAERLRRLRAQLVATP